VFDSAVLNGLYRDCYAYLHGHEVGGTNPSLLRAMHAGAPCIAVDVGFHREVVGRAGLYFGKEAGVLAELLGRIDQEPAEMAERGAQARARERSLYRWDAVVDAYASLFRALSERRGDLRRPAEWLPEEVYRPTTFGDAGARARS
jgi:glycosyltransferase involved in cell wall biosynthesis